jgi:hypothetical protein
MNGALFNFIGNMAGITTPIIIGYLPSSATARLSGKSSALT